MRSDTYDRALGRVLDRLRTLELWVARQRIVESANTSYDNTGSGLTGDTVQEAIDEVAAYGLDDLSDVNAPSPAAGDAPTWDGAEWVAVHALTESDVVAIITPTIYLCDSIAIEASKGTLDAGTHSDLHVVGGTTVHVSETATTPGFELRAAFSAVDGISDVYVHGYYTASHTVVIQLYNYDTVGWDTVVTFTPSASGFELLHAAIADGAPYVDGSDNALLRFYHADAGNPTHDLYLDYLALSFGGSGSGALALDDLTDVNAAAPDDGDVLTWDDYAAEWVAAAPGGGGDVATDTIWDAKGDLAVGTGSNTAARLAKGTDGHVLTADSGETTGLKWAAGDSGGGTWGISASRYSADSESYATTPAIAAEFNESTDSFTWDSAPATDDTTTYPGFRYIVITGSGNDKWLSRAWSPSGDLTIAMRISLAETLNTGSGMDIMFGVGNGTSSGTCTDGVFHTIFSTYGGADTGWQGYTRASSSWSAVGGPFSYRKSGNNVWYVRMTRTTNTWRFYISEDGIAWTEHPTTASKTFSPSYVILRVGDGGGICVVDWIRCWDGIVEAVGGSAA